MKQYVYKMQWLLPLNGDFTTTQARARANVANFIDAIGAKSFTIIYFRDEDLKRVDSYSNMVMYPTGETANDALKALIKTISKDSNIKHIEFIRK